MINFTETIFLRRKTHIGKENAPSRRGWGISPAYGIRQELALNGRNYLITVTYDGEIGFNEMLLPGRQVIDQ